MVLQVRSPELALLLDASRELLGRADDATDTGLPVWVSSFLQQGASSATASSAQVYSYLHYLDGLGSSH